MPRSTSPLPSHLRRLRIAFMAIALLVLSPRSSAQFFAPVGGPEGGWITSLVRDQASGAIYAGTSHQWGYNNAAGAVFKSIDGGVTWTRLATAVSGALESNTVVRGIAVTSSGTVFVGMRGAGVRRSVDGGSTFSAVSSGLPSQKIVALAAAPDGSVLAAVEQFGIYQLASGGSTWIASNTGLPNLVVRTVAVLGSTQLVGTSSGLYRRSTGSGTWSAPSVGVGSTGVNSISQGTAALYAACDNGVWLSLDGGTQWSQLSGPFSGIITYAAFESDSARLVGSQAGWHRSVAGGPWTAASGVATGAIPRCFLSGAGPLLAGTSEFGVLSSSDQGGSWTASNSGLVAHTVLRLSVTSAGSVLAGTRGGIYRKGGGGSTWDPPDIPGKNIFSLTQSPWGEVFAGNYNILSGVSDGHAFVSGDDGQSWTELAIGANPAMVSGFAFVPETHEVFASVAWNSGGVLRRNLDRSSWAVFGPADNPPCYFVGRSAVGDLYIGSEGRGVRRLPAGGSSSQWVNLGFNTSQQFAIAFSPNGHVFFGNDGVLRGIYRSVDGGQSFQPLDTYPSLYGHAIAITAEGTIFCAGRDVGVQRSTDDGATWQDVSAGLPTTSVLSLSIGPDGHLYAGTAGNGVFRSTAPVVVLCSCDLDHDGAVGGSDLAMMLGSWGACPSGCFGDFDANGSVDGADLGVLLSAWGACN